MTLVAPADERSGLQGTRTGGDVAGERDEPGADPLVRRRLLEALTEAAGHRLTVITAPRGYGKTELLRSWLAAGGAPGPVVRLAWAESDPEPEIFWRHLVVAMRRDAGFLEWASLLSSGLADPASPHRLPADILDRLVAALRRADRPVVLVVDRAERLGLLAMEELEELSRRSGRALRLVVASRETPLLRPPPTAARGSQFRLGREDLAFTAAEAGELLERHGVYLEDSAVTELVAATQGWPAAVRRAAIELAASANPDVDVHELVRRRTLTDVPLGELLDAQQPDVRSFLLRTSIVEPIWPGLATALTADDDATGTLAELLRANLFIRLAPEGGRSYTYEPMFRTLLRSRLEQEAPRDVGRLHLAAARWLAGSGRLTEAARHHIALGRWRDAAALVVEDLRVGELLCGVGPLPELFAALPESAAGPEACVVRACLRLSALHPSERPGLVETAMAAASLAEAEDESLDHADSLLLSVALLEVELARQGWDAHTGLLAARTAERLVATQPREVIRARPELVAMLLAGKGTLQLRTGDIEDAATTLADGIAASRGSGSARGLLACESRLALTEAIRGRLGQAEQHASAAESLARDLGSPAEDQDPAVRVARAWLHMERYAVRQARADLQGVAATPLSADDPAVTGAVALVRARLARAEGNPSAAIRMIGEIRSQTDLTSLPTWLDQRLRATSASVLAAMEEGAGAAPLPDLSDTPAPLDLRVETLLRRANRALSRGEARRARSALEQALRLAEPERLRRPVAEAPARVRRFLMSDDGLRARRLWLGPLTRSGVLVGTVEEVALAEPLTAKESEVLDHLAALLTTEEIAQTMFVSVNTVRSHVRSILRKLSATRRNEAVRHARELGLIGR
jgi:LuxR family maltose regulon positive regulatory protein